MFTFHCKIFAKMLQSYYYIRLRRRTSKCVQQINLIKYIEELTSIENDLAKRRKEALPAPDKKKLRARKKEIETAIEQEAKTLVKQRFDYIIPIADIKRAGINSIGIKIENDLEPLLKEYTKYRKENNLWNTRHAYTSYQYNDGGMTRIREFDGIVSEPEMFYGKD